MWGKINYSNWEIIYRKRNRFVNIENHEHQDYLHFTANYMGYPVLIDSGLASYMKNHIHSNARSAEYHNSILIDGYAYTPSNMKAFPDEYNNPDNLSKETKIKNGYKLILKTSGFDRIDKTINFERHILIDNESLTIIDNSNSEVNHRIENYFHFDNNLNFLDDPNYFKFNLNNSTIEFMNHTKELKDSKLNIYSKQYGITEKKKVLSSTNIINSSTPVIHRLNII